MALTDQYEQLISENQDLFDENYKGYIAESDRKATGRKIHQLGNSVKTIKDLLKSETSRVAKDHSIETFNKLNSLLNEMDPIVKSFEEETEHNLYSLPDVTISDSIELMEIDKKLRTQFNDLRAQARKIDGNESEEDIDILADSLRSFEEIAQERREFTEAIVTKYNTLANRVTQVGELFDNQKMNDAEILVLEILDEGEGLLKLHIEMVEAFKERQLFQSRKIERSLDRESSALKFFDLFVKVLEYLQEKLSSNPDMYSKSVYLDKANDAIAGLPKIAEKRKELYEKSSPEDTEEKEEEPQAEKKPKKPKQRNSNVSYKLPIIVGSIGLLIIVSFLFFLFVL